METRLKSLREDHDLYQKDIAKVLNMSQRGYSHYESGKNIPNELLILLAQYYNTSTDYILGLTNIREPYPKNKN
ncbi:MAG: helix-turn-helix transcriptional regulator [Bacilli bacterium]|nr:helix-turn-helix transcriptional regulator [Bacilli bacterium]